MLNQLVRYAPVTDLIRAVGGGSLLDVGSGSVGVSRWLGPEWTITATDIAFDDYGTAAGAAQDGVARMVADARALPFEDRSFDVVLTLDMLEHVAPADRSVVLRELARVARRRLIAACPAGTEALEADRRLDADYRRRGVDPPGWLAEHLDNGFPEPAELEGVLAPFGSVRLVGNESVGAHERLMAFEARPRLALLNVALLRALGPSAAGGPLRRPAAAALAALRGRDAAPTYRTIAVLDRADG
jgi:SAM-dependent methyltransferase